MKNKIKFIFLILLTLSVPVNNFSQNFKPVHDGVEYAELTRQIEGEPVKINLLRLDLKKVRLDVFHALGKAVGVDATSSIAKAHGAFAAINAGFFRLDTSIFLGDSAGILRIDGRFFSESLDGRIAMGIDNGKYGTKVNFGHTKTTIIMGFGVDSEIYIAGVNRERGKGEAVLYTPDFGASTLTGGGGAEIVLKVKCDGPIVRSCRGGVIAVNEGRGNSQIPADGMVVSLDKNFKEFDHYVLSIKSESNGQGLPVRIVPTVIVTDDISADNFNSAEDVVGGVPQLIKNGKIDITWAQEGQTEKFVKTRNPRTAIARLKDGKVLLVTVDGRSEASGGLGLYDLAALLLEFGAADAMNLDGGGSTTMFLDGKVVNHPSDPGGERKVGDALLVFPRKQ